MRPPSDKGGLEIIVNGGSFMNGYALWISAGAGIIALLYAILITNHIDNTRPIMNVLIIFPTSFKGEPWPFFIGI